MSRNLSATIACLCLAGVAFAKTTIALAPIIVSGDPKFKKMELASAQEIVSKHMNELFELAIDKNGAESVGSDMFQGAVELLKLKMSSNKEPWSTSTLRTINERIKADFILVVDVTSIKQENRDGALNSVQKNQSSTTAEARVWIYDCAKGVFVVAPDRKAFKGAVQGTYLSSTDPKDLSGNPEDKFLMINSELKKRSTLVAQAIWNAIKPTVLTYIKK